MYLPPLDVIKSLLYFLSSSNGAIFALTATPLCLTTSAATNPILLIFKLLSCGVNPKPLDKCNLTISPSKYVICL